MTRIKLKGQRGRLLRTRDAISPLGVTAAPPVDIGVTYSGSGSGMQPRERDLDAMRTLRDTGLLSPNAVAEINRILSKYSGVATGRTSQTGITSTDQARAAVAEVAATIARNHGVNEANAAFWNPRLARDRDDLLR